MGVYSSMEKYPPTSDSNSIFHGLNVQCASVKECINYGMNQLSNYFHGMIKDLKKIKVTDEEVHKGKYIRVIGPSQKFSLNMKN